MVFPFKKFLFSLIFNSSLFLILIISIQNSSIKRKVNFLINESIELPVSFIIGISYISGSITGSLLPLKSNSRKNG